MFVASEGSSSPPSFENYKILIPCISVGNVGQLTLDLLINTLRLPHVGYLNHPAVLPLVGNDAFDHTQPSGHLHTAAEVYQSSEKNLLAVQLRTPLIKSLRNDFCAKLLEWARDVGVSEVVVVTSSHAHERRDSQITGEQFRFLLSPSAHDLCTQFTEQLHWNVMEPRSLQPWDHHKAAAPPTSCLSSSPSEDQPAPPTSSSTPPSATSAEDQPPGVLAESQIFLPGAGLAKRLYRQCSLLGIRAVVMIGFCAQGDNIEDAVSMANRLDNWIQLRTERQEWLFPSSWSMMYGGPPPSNLF